jgi:hypothetical protein
LSKIDETESHFIFFKNGLSADLLERTFKTCLTTPKTKYSQRTPNLGIQADNPLHIKPEILKRGHSLPSEWDWRFDKNNQPVRRRLRIWRKYEMKRKLTKVFDYIKATADFSKPNNQSKSISNMTNIFDQTSSAKTYKLGDSIIASAEAGTMNMAEIQHVIAGLNEILEVRAAQHSAVARRIERLNAAKADPKMQDIIMQTDAHLKRIGFDDGVNDNHIGMTKLNSAMSAAGMDNLKRMTLKTACYQLGLIDWQSALPRVEARHDGVPLTRSGRLWCLRRLPRFCLANEGTCGALIVGSRSALFEASACGFSFFKWRMSIRREQGFQFCLQAHVAMPSS